jgi:nucleoside-diphosphate-sugar epimerase
MSASCTFVTGAGGFVGRHLCRRLRAAGHHVRALVRRGDSGLEALGVEIVRGDLAVDGPWQEALRGADFVIHCAAHAVFDGRAADMAINIDGTLKLISAARRSGERLKRFVFVSTIGAVDRAAGDSCSEPLDESSPLFPSSAYGRSKAQAERLLRESGLPFSIVRPAMVVGADMRSESHFAVFTRMALRRTLAAHVAWPGALSVVHVDDLASALELCATHPAAEGRTFFCAGSLLSIAECFELAHLGNTRLPVGWLAAAARTFPKLFPFRLKAMLLPALTASDAALRELGWSPTRTAKEALQEVIARERARLDPNLDPGGQTVITGAASGLGRALVHRLAGQRRQLLLLDRDGAGLAQIQKEFPHCRVAVVDLADEVALTGFLAESLWREPTVSEIYACAGFGLRGAVLDATAEQHARLFKVNVLSRLTLAHAALPGMIRAGFGRIVFVSSSSAFQPLPYLATYAASNAALLQLGEAWGAELAGTGVQMLQVCPGGMQTNFQQAAGVKVLPDEKLMSPDTVTAGILRALTQGKSTVIISARAHGMALTARLLPRALSVALWKKLMTRLR